MVQLILTAPQLVRLKAAVATGSAESAALEAGKRFGGEVFSPEPIAVKCTLAIATRLLSVANRFCPEVVPKIRAAIEQEKQWGGVLAHLRLVQHLPRRPLHRVPRRALPPGARRASSASALSRSCRRSLVILAHRIKSVADRRLERPPIVRLAQPVARVATSSMPRLLASERAPISARRERAGHRGLDAPASFAELHCWAYREGHSWR